jgi:hypothetical protein
MRAGSDPERAAAEREGDIDEAGYHVSIHARIAIKV